MKKSLCFKDYMKCVDDKTLSKTRRKVNSKNYKKRVYGLDHNYSPSVNGTSDSSGGDSGGIGESITEMHDGAIPGSLADKIVASLPYDNKKYGNEDMKKENRRKTPTGTSFHQWLLQMFGDAYDQEKEDEPYDELEIDDDFDDPDITNDLDVQPDTYYDVGDFASQEDEEDFEYDDIPGEEELVFDRDEEKIVYNDESDSITDEMIDDIDDVTGTITRWWRYDTEDTFHSEDRPKEEEQEIGPPKIDRARTLFRQLINRPDMTRGDMINEFVKQLDVTESTAVSYYERIAKEMGLTNDDTPAPPVGQQAVGAEQPASRPVSQLPADTYLDLQQNVQTSDNPKKQGIIRTVDGAHLVYKRQMDNGTFQELWIYNVGDTIQDGLEIRQKILAGTDIPRGKTRSDDQQQAYTLTTMGNAQLLHITGLPN